MLLASALLIILSTLLAPEQACTFDRLHATAPHATPPAPYGLNSVKPESGFDRTVGAQVLCFLLDREPT